MVVAITSFGAIVLYTLIAFGSHLNPGRPFYEMNPTSVAVLFLYFMTLSILAFIAAK
jgi:hypothetical protein